MAQYDVRTLARLVGVRPRTIRSYVAEGILEKPPFQARKTLYSDEHLIRARAARHLIASGQLMLRHVAGHLAKLSLREIEALIPAPAAAQATPASHFGDRWQRVVLMPGLEIHVMAGAPALERIARDIHERYALSVTL